jgi:6-phosphogluconolactonase
MTQTYSVFVSNAADGEIGAYRFDAASGKLEAETRYAADTNVMPLTWSPDGVTLYAATRGKQASIVTFDYDAGSGALTRRNAAPIESNLAYLSADASGRYLLGASYGENRASLYDAARIAAGEGGALQFVDGIQNAHCAVSTRDGRFAYVTSLGADTVHCFELRDGALHALDVVAVEKDFGPRHLRFSPDGRTLYVVSEFLATVGAFSCDTRTGKLGAMKVAAQADVLSSLQRGRVRPSSASGEQIDPAVLATLAWGADIQVTPDGRFVYVSERTSSRLIAYRVQDDGALTYAGSTDTETQPRGFRIDATGRFLVACGEKSTHVSAYAIDADTGALTLLSRCEGGKGANWVEIVARA